MASCTHIPATPTTLNHIRGFTPNQKRPGTTSPQLSFGRKKKWYCNLISIKAVLEFQEITENNDRVNNIHEKKDVNNAYYEPNYDFEKPAITG
jgi:hypothetical protein